MKKIAVIFIIALFATILFLGFFSPVSALRCQDDASLLNIGDSKMELVECLGEPVYKDNLIKTKYNPDTNTKIEKIIEQWFYEIDDIGYRVDIENGQVIYIKRIGRK